MENLVITLRTNNKYLKEYYKILEAVAGTDEARRNVAQQIENNIKQEADLTASNITAPKRTKEEQYIYDTYLKPIRDDNEEKEKPTKLYGGALMLSENGLDINQYRGCINELNEALKTLDAGTINNILAKTKRYIEAGKVKNPQGYIITSLQKARGGIV